MAFLPGDRARNVETPESKRAAPARAQLAAPMSNSLRALVKYLDGVFDHDIAELNIPTGLPLVNELDEALHPYCHHYLGNRLKKAPYL